MMRVRLGFVLATATLAAGCAATGELGLADDAAGLRAGRTTRAEVVTAMGEPQEVGRDSQGNVTYQYVREKSEGWGWKSRRVERVNVTIGTDDVVKNVDVRMDAHTGW